MKQRIILVLVAVATVALTAAPAALAVSSSVRIQGATFQVLPTTVVNESAAGGKIVDTDGTSFTTTNATALGATAAALQLGGLPWDMSIGTYGPYINSIDGLAMAGDYSNWWEIVVNGYSSPVGAGSLQTVAGDSYLWFQNPDATGIKPAFLLVTRVSGGTAKHGFTPGQTVTLTTVGDDLFKVNSQADATRFSTTDIQTPAQFPAVDGATVHVGSQVYSAAASTLAVKDLAPGTYAVWSEKVMDSTTVYATSATTLFNVGAKPTLGTLAAGRTNAKTVKVRFKLSERSTVTIAVTKGSKVLAKWSGARAAGAQTLTLHLSPAAPKTTSITVKITAVDGWGRTSVRTIVVPKGK